MTVGMMMGLDGWSVPASAAIFSITATANASDSSGGLTVSYGTLSIGSADVNRVVAVAIMARIASNFTVSSVSIGGNAATQVTGAPSASTSTLCDIWYLAVPAGTTASVSVTYGASSIASVIEVYSVVTATPTPSSGQQISGATGALSKAITIPVGGGVIGAYCIVTGGLATVTWSGGTLVKDCDQQITGNRTFSTAHDVVDTGSTTLTATASAGTGQETLSLAAWSP